LDLFETFPVERDVLLGRRLVLDDFLLHGLVFVEADLAMTGEALRVVVPHLALQHAALVVQRVFRVVNTLNFHFLLAVLLLRLLVVL
jgi:hypothetical protein